MVPSLRSRLPPPPTSRAGPRQRETDAWITSDRDYRGELYPNSILAAWRAKNVQDRVRPRQTGRGFLSRRVCSYVLSEPARRSQVTVWRDLFKSCASRVQPAPDAGRRGGSGAVPWSGSAGGFSAAAPLGSASSSGPL